MPRRLARGDLDGAGLDPADQAMLAYAVKLTVRPYAMEQGDVGALRRHDFDDAAIHDIAHVTSYYNYVNRMADGLGIELEDGWSAHELTLSRDEFAALRGGRA